MCVNLRLMVIELRSAYKLIEIDEKFKSVQRWHDVLVDIGAAPG